MRDDRDGNGAEAGDSRDYRALPVEVLRRYAQDQAELTSIRQVAAEIGLGRTTLHKFVAGETTPHPRVRRLLGLWYLRQHGRLASDESVRPYASALDLLLSAVPGAARPRAAREMLEVLHRGAAEAGGPPDWLDSLRARTGEDG